MAPTGRGPDPPPPRAHREPCLGSLLGGSTLTHPQQCRARRLLPEIGMHPAATCEVVLGVRVVLGSRAGSSAAHPPRSMGGFFEAVSALAVRRRLGGGVSFGFRRLCMHCRTRHYQCQPHGWCARQQHHSHRKWGRGRSSYNHLWLVLPGSCRPGSNGNLHGARDLRGAHRSQWRYRRCQQWGHRAHNGDDSDGCVCWPRVDLLH